MIIITKAIDKIYNGKLMHIRRRYESIKDLLKNEVIPLTM